MEQHDLSKIQKLQEKGKSDKIIKYLSSSDDTVVVAALEALSRIKDEDSVNSIAHMIDNPDTKIRVEAAKALGSIGTEYTFSLLLASGSFRAPFFTFFILRNLEKSCDGFCLKLRRISIYNRTVREKSSFVVMEVV